METYYIITIGCQMNKSDSERVAGYLNQHGWQPATDYSRADLIIVNTCGVRQSAEDRIYGLIPRLRRNNRKAKIVLTGCLVYRQDVKRKVGDKVDIWLAISELPYLVEKIKKFDNIDSGVSFSPAKKKDAVLVEQEGQSYLKIKPKYSSHFSAFVPIGNGCNNFCTYCVVPYARGREVYRPAEEIINEVKGLVKKGYREITLIAQNVNSYNNATSQEYINGVNKLTRNNVNSQNFSQTNKQKNLNTSSQIINFPILLKMVNNIKGDFWLRFTTSHPKDMSDELITTIATSDKVCEHIHLPVQAGDDEILRRMNRNYTVVHYKSLIKKIRQVYRQKNKGNDWCLPPAITTDVIVGFPGETREQFKNTVKLFREIKFDLAYIAQYSPRPGTVAAKMTDDVPSEEKKRREKELTVILRQTARNNNERYINQVVDVLIEGINRKGEYFGRTRTNKNVKIQGIKKEKNLVGRVEKVKIISAQDFGLTGEIKNKRG